MRKFNERLFCLFAVIIVVLSFGCAHYQLNQPLTSAKQGETYDFRLLDKNQDAEKTFVVLTFSGGGTRAAALAYGVLDQLRRIPLPGTGKAVINDVDVISTVSGGSFTGAYYALFGDRIFVDFKDKFLYRNIEKELVLKLLNPVSWFLLASPYYSRIDMAAELYDRTIFESKTFENLTEKGKRPFLIINATNLSQGARFEFTGDQFSHIGSDILQFPVARAVAASSAFPFLLSPVSLKNYPHSADVSEEEELALKDYWVNKRRYYTAKNELIFNDVSDHPYIHLMDGGLADNLGLRAIYDLYVRGGIREKINNGEIKYFLVIVVNAKTKAPEDIDLKESPPGLLTVGVKTCTISMDNYTFDTVEIFKSLIEERAKAQRNITECQDLLDKYCPEGHKLPGLAGGQVKLYIVDLSFDNLSDKEERDFFNNLPTSFALDKSEVEKLIEVGGRLLVEHPQFKKFLSEYKSE
ncbi:MAG: patatin-like phospholipase family protein [Dissulfurispiraceae bacterium]